MDAKDLMIGDWVTVVADDKLFPEKYVGNTIPCKVMGFDDKPIIRPSFTEKASGIDLRPQIGMMVKVANNFHFMYFVPERLSPIPLTKDILEKNGFEDIGDETWQLSDRPYWFWVDFFNHRYGCEFDTSTYDYEDFERRLYLYGIPSVHELQHAMRLCEIEKEIVL